MPAPRFGYICSACGGSNLLMDAWARWDIETQDWVLADTLTQAYCRDCEGETCLVEREFAESA